MWASIAALFHACGLLSSINAVMTTRTAQGAVAWVISLNTCPYLAVPAYWILGRNRFDGYSTARRSASASVQSKLNKVLEGLAAYRVPELDASSPASAAEKLAGLPFLGGNRLQLLIDGAATFESILQGIDAANDYVLVQFYIVHDDDLGRQLKDHLVARAKAGVRVHFLYDEIGSYDLPKSYINDLRQAGVEIYDFHTRKGARNRFQVNFRNHRKIVVADGKVAWIGGHNVGDEYLGKDPDIGNWRDTHMRIEGPAVLPVQVSFVEDWHWATDRILDGLTWTPTAAGTGDTKVLILPTGPGDPLETAALMFLHAINSAKKRIWIATPYFVPDEAILGALQLAGLRGVDVRILIPDKSDIASIYLAGFPSFETATRTGAHIYRYKDGFLHQKVMLIDDTMATVGTAYFDNRSFRLNFEITGIVADPGFAAEIEKMLLADLALSREMTQSEMKAQSYGFMLAARLARLTAPIQ